MPFLLSNPLAYLRGALGGFGDLKHKWTVNWKFLPPAAFHAPAFPLLLAACHLLALAYLATRVWTKRQGGLAKALQVAASKTLTAAGSAAGSGGGGGSSAGGGSSGGGGGSGGDGEVPPALLHPEHILVTLLSCNAVGVIFARSLHFQFYCWYIHSVPLLLWRCEQLPLALKLTCFALLEYAWSYGLDKQEGTSTPLSSGCLQLAHAILLYAIVCAPPPRTYAADHN